MTVKSAQQWSGIVVTRDATGALAAAAVGPAGTLYVDGVANGAGVTISGANPYKWTVTLPALTVGQCVSMYLTATIGAIATAAVVAEDVADTYVASDVKTDTAAILLDTGTDGVVLKAAGLATDAAEEIADAVLNEAAAGHTGVIAVNLDAAISTRAVAGDAMALTAAAVDAVWNELTAGHAVAGSTGKALSDAGAAGDPWAAPVRTLTSSAAATAATVAGSSITITRGDTASISITGLGSLALRTKLWFTVKNKHSDADTASVLQVEETGGLLYLNGAATTITNATLVVDDEAAGNITVTIKAAATAALSPSTYSYDVQQLTSDPAVHTETAGTFTVSADYTRAVA